MIIENILYRNDYLTITEMASDSDNYVIRFKATKNMVIALPGVDKIELRANITTAFPSTSGRKRALLVAENLDHIETLFM